MAQVPLDDAIAWMRVEFARVADDLRAIPAGFGGDEQTRARLAGQIEQRIASAWAVLEHRIHELRRRGLN